MEIRDVLYGGISIEPHERAVLDSTFSQRLRQIKQLGFAEYSYPSAVHNRYTHSLGAMRVASRAFEVLFAQKLHRTSPQTHFSFRACVRLAALLHDIGHGPLSHTTEFAMPPLKDLGLDRFLPFLKGETRQATHEDYTLKILLDSDFTPILERATKTFGFKPIHVAALIEPAIDTGDDFFREPFEGERSVDFRPILQQLISSELDADRMDYLRRDSFHAGVSYGMYDHDWLISNLGHHLVRDEKGQASAYLALGHRALYAFEDFLLSRYHMFLMVYFHYKSVIYDEMLMKYFETAPGEYTLPSDIDAYCAVHDAHLYAALARSDNEWARRITEKRAYAMLYETHSGIPFRPEGKVRARERLEALKKRLEGKGVHYVETRSEGELSKYYQKPGLPIYVHYHDQFHPEEFIPLGECTDLFEKYGENRSITRLYVAPEDLARARAN